MTNEGMEITVYTQAQYNRLKDRISLLDAVIEKRDATIAGMQDDYAKLSGDKTSLIEDSEAAQQAFILINKKLESDINEYRMAAKSREEVMVIQDRVVETDREDLLILRQECERYESEKLDLIKTINILADEVCRKSGD